MFQGFFEWVMGVITYVLSFFGIIISKPTAGGASDAAQVTEEKAEVPALSAESSNSSE